jgi:alkylation response protein AidB-like acyl-CoA dehydrogenase|tara:strand:+ start:415 stop:657 length:243 start_codon:yes stop_codon:yes gene_type:complete
MNITGYSSVTDQCGFIELVGTLLSVHGTKEQCTEYLVDVFAAKKIIVFCITEAEARSDVTNIRTQQMRQKTCLRDFSPQV